MTTLANDRDVSTQAGMEASRHTSRASGLGAGGRDRLYLDNPGAHIWGHFKVFSGIFRYFQVFWVILGLFWALWGYFGVFWDSGILGYS